MGSHHGRVSARCIHRRRSVAGDTRTHIIQDLAMTETTRPLYVIAHEIRRDWKKVYFGALPYLDAMGSLHTVHDTYIVESAASIVRYFLANASTWRGETAQRIKRELSAMVEN
jgi:hypothetical protein